VNSGGQKVYPEEVEGALKSHPEVFDALVIGIPDERYGESVAALVEPRPGTAPDLGAVAAHLRGQIAGFKIPRSIWLVDEISRSPVGKPRYGWARELAASQPPAWRSGSSTASTAD
jgi:3-oxocholest-4-en-26-oate---CoA ligase